MPSPRLGRRHFLRAGLLFSASLMVPRAAWARKPSSAALDLFCFGDWGTGADASQTAVARALQGYAMTQGVTPDALVLLGDNFYGPLPGVDSPRWRKEFEDMYPATAFPGPCYAILGNHDYDDQSGGEEVQLAYAKKPGTRWTMPALWYRVDLPARDPLVTLLCTDTHYDKLSREAIAAQQDWLETQLAAPRVAPWLMVCGHHPVLSCGSRHGDSKRRASWRTLFNDRRVHGYLCGHEHDLQHLRPEGTFTDWWVSGGGGRSLHAVSAEPGVQFAREALGFLHLAITRERLSASFIGTDGRPVYTFERPPA